MYDLAASVLESRLLYRVDPAGSLAGRRTNYVPSERVNLLDGITALVYMQNCQ